ncbi:MAG: SET domain-containing protein [Saprospiraceae bacterium]|jgi:SET domain-containing protein
MTESEGRGRGIFTSETIEIDDIIEICPLIILPKSEIQLLDKTMIHDYYFLLPDDSENACLPLGYGMLYNHHPEPNAEVVFDLPNNFIQIHCIQVITAGEEIFINYQNVEIEEKKPSLWFDVK